jgi:hypothetical protein
MQFTFLGHLRDVPDYKINEGCPVATEQPGKEN